jgi:hypothetical protein
VRLEANITITKPTAPIIADQTNNWHPKTEQQPYTTSESGTVTWRLRTLAIGCSATDRVLPWQDASLLRTQDEWCA